jgi:hypothetical protein
LRSKDPNITAYFDNVKLEAYKPTPAQANDISHLRSIDSDKVAQGNEYSKLSFVDGWFNVKDSPVYTYHTPVTEDGNWHDDPSYQPYVTEYEFWTQGEGQIEARKWLANNPDASYVYFAYWQLIPLTIKVQKVSVTTTDYVEVLRDMGTSSKQTISNDTYIQYFYTDIFVSQDKLITEDWEIEATKSGTMDGTLYLWINGQNCATGDFGTTWQDLKLVKGINSIQLAYVPDNSNNTDIKFKVELTAPDTGIKFITLTPDESRTRQQAILYDPQYQSKWITRSDEPTNNNIEKDNGDKLDLVGDKRLDLPMNEGSGNWSMDVSNYDGMGKHYSTTWEDNVVKFDGTASSYIILPVGTIDGMNDYTVSFWVKSTDLDKEMNCVIHGTQTGGNDFSIEFDDEYIHHYIEGIEYQWSTANHSENEWYFVTLVRDDNKLLFYEGGELQHTISSVSTSTIGVTGGRLVVGQEQDSIVGGHSSSQALEGYLKNLEIWDYALDNESIKKAMLKNYYDVKEDNVNLIKEALNINLLSIGMPTTVMNATRMKYYMQTEINMYARTQNEVLWHPFGQILSTTDVLPEEIWDGTANNSMIEKYLEQGGKLVWPGGYPMFGIKAAKGEPISYTPIENSSSYTRDLNDDPDWEERLGTYWIDKGTHEVEWQHWDNDFSDEIRLEFRKSGETTVYLSANRDSDGGGEPAEDEWRKEYGFIELPVSGNWEIWGKQTDDDNNYWGVRYPHVGSSNNYIGETRYEYPGALGHQFILDINDNNNSNALRSDFEVGMIAYNSSHDYNDDDYNFREEGGAKNVLSRNYYPAPDRNNNYELIKYNDINGGHPAFTQSAWTGLAAHMILGKHEFDIQHCILDGTNNDEFKIVNIDGYSGDDEPFADCISHANVDQSDMDEINVDNFGEIGVDPMDMGLWFKPYLGDTNGAIEIGGYTDAGNDWYAKHEYPTNQDLRYYHSELWNVGTGSVQAGENGRGIISVLPMFNWDDNNLPLTGVQVKNGTTAINSSSDFYGLYSNRGSGGIINTPSTRDSVLGKLGLIIGSMMITIALQNIVTNALRDNDTTSTNLLNPSFTISQLPNDKYPYTNPTHLSIRSNDGYGYDYDGDELGTDGIEEEEQYISYPLYTGTYQKWLFSTNSSLPGQTTGAFVEIDDSDTLVSVTELVYENNNLHTAMITETGGYDGESIDPHERPQYLSVENVSFSGTSSSSNLSVGVNAAIDNQSVAIYGSNVTGSSGNRYSFGVSPDTHVGTGGFNGKYEWQTYPKASGNIDMSPSQYMSYMMDEPNIPWSDRLVHNDDMNREIITRHPLVNLYNNQMAYESGLSEASISYNTVPRGGTGSNDYGGTMPWSYTSPIIIDDQASTDDIINLSDGFWYVYDNLDDSLFTEYPYGWIYRFIHDKVIDDDIMDNTYGGWNSSGETKQWLSTGSDHTITIYNNWPQLSFSMDLIKITPALNCMRDFGSYNNYLKVEQIKTLKVDILKGDPFDGNVLKSYIVHPQKWQTTDIVIPVNPLLTAEDKLLSRGIRLQILEVWDDDYGAFEADDGYTLHIDDNGADADENFGGIAEVEIYGRQYSGSYEPMDTEISPFSYPEDSIRFPDSDAPWCIDGGSYWTDGVNEDYNRSMSTGSYTVNLGVSRNEGDVGGLRYEASQSVKVNSASTDYTPEFIGYWQEYIAEQKRNQDLQTFWMIVSLVAVIVVAALTAGIGAYLGAGILAAAGFIETGITIGAAVGIGVSAGISTAKFITAFVITVQVVGLFAPEVSAFATTVVFQWTDILVGGMIHLFCELMDNTGSAWFNGGDNTHWWRKNIQPILYTLYAAVWDTDGTLPRLIARTTMDIFTDASSAELDYFMYDDYEKAMLDGETYNFLDIPSYIDQDPPPA